MDVLITYVYDKERFIHYIRLKFSIRKYTALKLPNDINEGCYIKLTGIPECDVRYLQQYVCTLKIIKYTPMRPRINPASFVNEEGRFQKKEKQPEDVTLFKVKFTKIIHFDEHLTKRQIEELLENPEVKSINVEK
jgi:hypothetical protein